MKMFKKLAGLCLALTLCVGLGAIASCGGSSKDDDKSTTSEAPAPATKYEVTVLNADGTSATDVKVQFCAMNADGTLGACYAPVAVDANGVCAYSPMGFPGVGIYEIHVLDSLSQPLELAEHVVTEATFGEYTVTLAE